MMSPETLNPALISDALAAAGFQCPPSDVQLDAREELCCVRLPARRMAWFATSARGLEQLRTERRVLRLLEARCSFRAPRVLFESTDGSFDVRSMVPGSNAPWSLYAAIRDNRERAVQLGAALGSILAEQHTRIGAGDVATWLPRCPDWPEPREWISERLPRVVDDVDLIARAESVMDSYESVAVEESDRALVHTDVGLHNLGIDEESLTLHGIYDYRAAAWADRHHDFRNLVFDGDRYDLLTAASSAYEAAVGHTIRHERVLLYNAACAISFLAYRAGIAPEEHWCGRTLAEDLAWSRLAITKALALPN